MTYKKFTKFDKIIRHETLSQGIIELIRIIDARNYSFNIIGSEYKLCLDKYGKPLISLYSTKLTQCDVISFLILHVLPEEYFVIDNDDFLFRLGLLEFIIKSTSISSAREIISTVYNSEIMINNLYSVLPSWSVISTIDLLVDHLNRILERMYKYKTKNTMKWENTY